MEKRGRGRPSILGRPMTGAERVRRHRYFKGWMEAQLKRWEKKYRRGPQQHNWNRNAPPDVLGRELAAACYDWTTHQFDADRWQQINAMVLEYAADLERDFASISVT